MAKTVPAVLLGTALVKAITATTRISSCWSILYLHDSDIQPSALWLPRITPHWPLSHFINKTPQLLSHHSHSYTSTRETVNHKIMMGDILDGSPGRKPSILSVKPNDLWVTDEIIGKKTESQTHILQLYGKFICNEKQRSFIEWAPDQNTKKVHYIPQYPVQEDPPTTPVQIIIVYNYSCCHSMLA